VAISNSEALNTRLLYFRYTKIRNKESKLSLSIQIREWGIGNFMTKKWEKGGERGGWQKTNKGVREGWKERYTPHPHTPHQKQWTLKLPGELEMPFCLTIGKTRSTKTEPRVSTTLTTCLVLDQEL